MVRWGVLERHAAMITTLHQGHGESGHCGRESRSFDLNGGTVEVLDNKVLILAS